MNSNTDYGIKFFRDLNSFDHAMQLNTTPSGIYFASYSSNNEVVRVTRLQRLPKTVTVKVPQRFLPETGLPEVTNADNGKIPRVVQGKWKIVNPDFGVNFTTDETLTLNNGVLSVNTTNDAAQDNTRPITSAGVNTIVGNINAFLETL